MAEKEFKNETDRFLDLQRKDPTAFWLRRAHENAVRLNLPVDFLGEAIGILTGAVSQQWVREQATKHRKGGVLHSGHPLIKAITVAGDNDLVSVVELAIYLKRLFTVDGLQEVIHSSLRAENKFDSALLQLAWAYRFHKIGAQVRLEPAAARGQADIHLTWRDKEYMVECYIPSEETDQDQIEDVLSFSLGKMTEVASNVGKVVRVLIRFFTYPDTPQRLALEKAAARLIRDVPQGGSVRALVTCADVEIQEITGQFDDDFLEDGTLNENGRYSASADGCMARSLVSLERFMEPPGRSSPSLQRERESRVFWWLPPLESQSPAERISELSNRITEKLKQTRTEEGKAKQIVIAQVPKGVGRWRNDRARMIARGVQQRLVSKHEGIAAIILTSRIWTTEYRFRYFSFILGGKEHNEIADEIYQKVIRIGFDFDLLHDWR